MAKKTFKGRPLLAGNLDGQALASTQPLNTTGSYWKICLQAELTVLLALMPTTRLFTKKTSVAQSFVPRRRWAHPWEGPP